MRFEDGYQELIDLASTHHNYVMMNDGTYDYERYGFEPRVVPQEEFQAMSRKERREQPARITPQEGFQRFGEAMGGAIAGAVPGAVAGSVGAPGDIAALFKGAYDAATAEEGQRLDAFLNTVTEISEQYGSERALKLISDTADVLPVSDQVKEGIKAGAEAGSFVGVGGTVTAGSKAALRGAKEYAAGAPARVAERGTGVTLQSGFDPMAVLDEAIVAGQGLIPAVKGVKPGDALLVQHNLNPESIEDIEVLGGLPVPSLAIVKSSTPLEKFGSITLIGTPDMAKPSARNPVYRSDAYVKRRPGITFEEDSSPTFYNQKTRKEQKATLKNMVSAMKGGAGEEMMGVTAGNLRAIAAKPFKTLAEVKKSRDRLVSEKDMMKVKDEIDRQYIGLVNYISDDIADIEQRYRNSGMDYNDITKDLVRGTMKDEEILSRLSDETKQRLEIFRESSTNLPTEYFEINPQRAVALDEFKAALVPEDLPESDIKALEKAGAKNIIKYKDEADRVEKIKSMRDVMFTVGAVTTVGGGAMKGMTGTESNQGEAQ